MVLAGAASGSPACVTAECSPRLNTKRGLLLTGDGHGRIDGSGPGARVTVETRRTTWWVGEEGETITVGPS